MNFKYLSLAGAGRVAAQRTSPYLPLPCSPIARLRALKSFCAMRSSEAFAALTTSSTTCYISSAPNLRTRIESCTQRERLCWVERALRATSQSLSKKVWGHKLDDT
jgi:hypothetical protein